VVLISTSTLNCTAQLHTRWSTQRQQQQRRLVAAVVVAAEVGWGGEGVSGSMSPSSSSGIGQGAPGEASI
jgi:hypothetical protein